MRPLNGDGDGAAFRRHGHRQLAVGAQRVFVLRNLVPLGQVRVKILFAVKPDDGVDVAAQGQAGDHGFDQHLAVDDGQGARVAQTHGAHGRVGRRAAARQRAPAKRFGGGGQLEVGFDADDGFVVGE